jgi:hypothetical protein
MVGRGVVAHRLRQAPLLLQPIITLLFEFANSVGREELARHPVLAQLPGDSLGAILAELKGTGMARIGPRATWAIKAIRLVHRQQCPGAFELDALVAQGFGGGVQRPPAAGRQVIRCELRLAGRLLLRFGRNGRRRKLIAHNRRLHSDVAGATFIVTSNTQSPRASAWKSAAATCNRLAEKDLIDPVLRERWWPHHRSHQRSHHRQRSRASRLPRRSWTSVSPFWV